MLSINLLAVILAAIAAFIIGFLLHGPVSGKLWMKLADVHPTGNEKFKDMIPQMLWNLLSNFVTAYALAMFYIFVSTSSISGGPGVMTGIISSFWLWLGFIVTGSSLEVIWMKRKVSLWLFECFASLAALIAMGVIIASL